MAIQRWHVWWRPEGLREDLDVNGRWVLFTHHEREMQGRYSWEQIEAAIRESHQFMTGYEILGCDEIVKRVRARLDILRQIQAGAAERKEGKNV